MASSTNNHNDNMRANIVKKLSVCPNNAITVKVIKNTSGADIHATSASFIQMIAKRLKNTKNTVISQSLTRCSRSSFILSELS